MTCPRCRKTKMFASPLYKFKPFDMKKSCPVCHQKFEPEPGFYYGAMFISYIFIGFLSLGVVGLLVFKFNLSVDLAFVILLVFIGLIFMWNLRFSRSLWIHLVVKHDPKAEQRVVERN